jgi:hypothetical protein
MKPYAAELARYWPAGFPGHCGNGSTPSWSRPWTATSLNRRGHSVKQGKPLVAGGVHV